MCASSSASNCTTMASTSKVKTNNIIRVVSIIISNYQFAFDFVGKCTTKSPYPQEYGQMVGRFQTNGRKKRRIVGRKDKLSDDYASFCVCLYVVGVIPNLARKLRVKVSALVNPLAILTCSTVSSGLSFIRRTAWSRRNSRT